MSPDYFDGIYNAKLNQKARKLHQVIALNIAKLKITNKARANLKYPNRLLQKVGQKEKAYINSITALTSDMKRRDMQL
ncbi:MAG: hypothetical protein C0172_02295 [Caldisphaera sp.]|nr:MAG: hypothetical protein C0201_00655 [Caldisphaera sp.]PMP88588.1 MAG: hypothetical protein C0172_02295 [Caldisphaera sp.]